MQSGSKRKRHKQKKERLGQRREWCSWQCERCQSRVIQYSEQWNLYCHQPVIDIQSPAQLACQNMQFYTSNGHNLTSLHITDEEKQKTKQKKSSYVQDHHWQTLIILVGSYIFIYIYSVCVYMEGIYTCYNHNTTINNIGMYWI